ncbi:hypothetical protein B0H16DRAFT_163345 [Mycena metata]|uniref:Uncharacterized protein n=1 Tax=Mycena metata TaxID=1033252 RepID=A0AAD7I4A0_9AGAR|nr:hypothetical protein B0H16DRAFT_163345 [Mycena metata]
MEALCCQASGKYQECISLAMRAHSLAQLCGMSHGVMDFSFMTCLAEVHALKSEYTHAYDLYRQLLQTYHGRQMYYEGLSLVNIAGVEVPMEVSYEVIQEKIDKSQVIFRKTGDQRLLTLCDTVQADLNLREGDMSCSLFCKCLKFGWGSISEIVSYCLERLTDVTRWSSGHDSSWTIILLAHSLKTKEKLGVHKALQFIGDVHHRKNDDGTAVNLFTVALEGFTYMDVHRSRAECMIRLGDHSQEEWGCGEGTGTVGNCKATL